jgi:hypothetical protein
MIGQAAAGPSTRRVWTPAEVVALGVRTDVPTAGEILAGLCRDEAYRSVKRGDFPVPVLKVGRRLVVPVAPILELLGIKPDDQLPAEPISRDASLAIARDSPTGDVDAA